jgi:hypothetical protein
MRPSSIATSPVKGCARSVDDGACADEKVVHGVFDRDAKRQPYHTLSPAGEGRGTRREARRDTLSLAGEEREGMRRERAEHPLRERRVRDEARSAE